MQDPRLVPVDPPYSPAVQAALDTIMPPGVPPLALFRTLAVNERVFTRVMAAGLLDRGAISLREREIVICRTCFRCGAEYEWGVHVAFFAPRAELTEGEIRALTATDLEETPFSPRERLLLRLVDELHDTATLGDALYAELAREWKPDQLVELVILAGWYHAVSFAVNAFRIPFEPWAARFPAA